MSDFDRGFVPASDEDRKIITDLMREVEEDNGMRERRFRDMYLGEWEPHDATTCRVPKCEACRERRHANKG
jgi:hypothetical protein